MSQPIQHNDLGQGLDGLRPEHKLGDGYWLDSVNCDPSLSGSIGKRTGYSLYAGLVPLRVRALTRSGTTMTISLPNWIDATKLTGRIILLYGRTSAATGDFTTSNASYLRTMTPGSANNITISCANSGAASDTSPQMVVYGIDWDRFSAKASNAGTRAGWVHHIDTFREGSTGRQWPVCGFGGNLLAGHDNASLSSGLSDVLHPLVRLTHEAVDRRIGPAFWGDGFNPNLARGYLSHADAESHVVPITSIVWTSGNQARFTVGGTTTASQTLSNILRVDGDWLSVEQAPFSIFNGQFLIKGSSLSSGTLTIDCEVPGLEDERFDSAACGAFGGVFTDALSTNGTGNPLPPTASVLAGVSSRIVFNQGDIHASLNKVVKANAWEDNQEIVFNIVSGATPNGLTDNTTYWVDRISDSEFGLRSSVDGSAVAFSPNGAGTYEFSIADDQERWTVLSNNGIVTYLSDVNRRALIQAGRAVRASYTGRVVQLRDVGGSSADAGILVEGDVLKVDSHVEGVRPKVKNRTISANVTINSIAGDGTTATVTTATAINTTLAVGDLLMLSGSPHFSGEVEITEILGATSFTFASAVEATDSGMAMAILGSCIGVDLETEWTDGYSDSESTDIEIFRRWQPIEFVESPNTALIDFNTVQHFDYFDDEEQPFLKSVMSNDSMYFTNGYDEVFKYDGVNLIRAGLPPQQLVSLAGPYLSVPDVGKITDANQGLALTSLNPGYMIFTDPGQGASYSSGDETGATGEDGGGSTESVYHQRVVVKEPTGINPGEFGWAASEYRPYTIGAKSLLKLHKRRYLGYYARMESRDRHGKVTGSAVCQTQDLVYSLIPNAASEVSLFRCPAWPGLDHSRIEIQPYRRPLSDWTIQAASDGKLSYDLIRPILTDWSTGGHRYSLKDAQTSYPRSPDYFNYALKGVEIASSLAFPPRASCISSAASRLLLGNIKSYPFFSVKLISANTGDGPGSIANKLNGARIELRKGADNTVNTSVQTFEFVNTTHSSGSVLTFPSSSTMRLTDTAGTFSGFSIGNWVYIGHRNAEIGRVPSPSTEYLGWHQVTATDGSSYLEFSFKGKASLTISSVDSGTDTITLSSAHGLSIGESAYVSFSGSLPTPLVERYNYQFTATSTTSGTLKNTENPKAAINLTTTTTGGLMTFGNVYQTLGFVSSTPDPIVWAASNKTRVPIPIADSSASGVFNYYPSPGLDTVANSVVSSASSYLNFLATWVSYAINAAQVSCTQSGFRPWLLARAGEDYSAGEIYIESPIANTETPTLTMTFSTTNGLSPYVNETLLTTGASVQAKTLQFPSRLCRSPLNYPEVFDDPYNQSSALSDSAIDVDPASGGEITAVIPMFGESTSGSAQLSSAVLVAKTNGWYAVDVETKAVQKLDTNGIGCDFPRTLTQTKNGVGFAHRSGLYKINSSMHLVPLGQILGRKWDAIDTADDADLSLASATHDAKRNRYVVTLPTVDNDTDEPPVHYGFSYDHTREVNPSGLSAMGGTNGLGSWTEYDNLPAIGWANLGIDSLFATANGRVYARNRSNTNLDFRDDEEAIEASAVYKLLNFGVTGIRKILRGLVLTFRAVSSQVATAASWAASARLAFEAFDEFTLDAGAAQNGTGDVLQPSIHTVKLSAPERKGDLMTVKVENDGLYETFELTDMTFFVDPLSDQGVREAADDDA